MSETARQSAAEQTWFAAFGGKTDRRDSFIAVRAMHISDEIDDACTFGLGASTPAARADAIRCILLALGEPDPWP